MVLHNLLAYKLKKLRMEKQLSQKEVADKLNVTHQTISAWETGKTLPDLETLVQLCILYNTSLDELCEFEQTSQDKIFRLELEKEKKQDFILSIIEQVSIMVSSIILSLIPYIGIFPPIGLIIWMLCKKKKYYFVYVVCIIALVIGVINTYVALGQILDIGNATIEKVN